MDYIFFTLLVYALICGSFCAFLANNKGRSGFVWFVLGFFFGIFALIAIAAAGKIEQPTTRAGWQEHGRPESHPGAESIHSDNSLQGAPAQRRDTTNRLKPYSGNRDTTDPAYQLYLTKRYAIERNNTLQKFVIDDLVFNSLEEAITAADQRYESDTAPKKKTLPPFDCQSCTLEQLVRELTAREHQVTQPTPGQFVITTKSGLTVYSHSEAKFRDNATRTMNEAS